MGYGYHFTCKKCKKDYSVFLGEGMMLREYEQIVEDIKAGEWGEEWKRILENECFALPDGKAELYICRTCGRWSVEPNLSLYVPNDWKALLREMSGSDTVEEWQNVTYVIPWQMEQDYHLLKRRIHICTCGKRLHKASEAETKNLACPTCGTVNEAEGNICWD